MHCMYYNITRECMLSMTWYTVRVVYTVGGVYDHIRADDAL